MTGMQKILIFGIGNPYRCDDSIGLKVVDILKQKLNNSHITIKSGSIDGLGILDEIMGYDKVLFIDSIETKQGNPGDVYKIELDPLNINQSVCASHGIDFATAVRMGKKFGYQMPQIVHIYAVEIEDNVSFSEECTEKVRESIPEVVKRIVEEINE